MQTLLPEAIITAYDEFNKEEVLSASYSGQTVCVLVPVIGMKYRLSGEVIADGYRICGCSMPDRCRRVKSSVQITKIYLESAGRPEDS